MHYGSEIELEAPDTSIPLEVKPESTRARPSSRYPRPTTRRPPPRPKSGQLGLGLFVLAMFSGFALELTTHGAFFRHDVNRFMKRDEHAVLEQDLQHAVHAQYAFDTFDHSAAALPLIDDALAKAPHKKTLRAFAAWALFAHELRFGPDAARHARASTLLVEAEGPWQRLAIAARDVLDREPTRALASAKAALAGDPENPEAHLVAGLAYKLARSDKEAIAALDRAVGLDQSARTRGALVAALEGIDPTRAKESGKLLADVADAHVGARLTLARLAAKDKDQATFDKRVSELAKLGAFAGPAERSEIERLQRLANSKPGPHQ